MKKIIIPILTVLFLSSCSDYLDEVSRTDLTAGLIYSTEEGLESAVVGLYNLERDYYTHHPEGRHAFSIMLGTDISVYRTSGDDGAAYYDANMNPTNWTVGSIWRHHHKIVDRANSVIKNVEDVSMTETKRNQLLAEAKCFRAHSYFHLYRLYENIYVTEEPWTDVDINISPSSRAEIFNLIRKDLDFAIDHLAWIPEQSGRYNQATARHLRADLALWEEDYAEAERQALTIINEGPHHLLNDVRDVFEPDDLDHAESLHVVHFNITEPGNERKFHRFPLLFMPRYDMVNGLQSSYEYGGLAWGRAYPNNYVLSLYDTTDQRYKHWYQITFLYNDPDGLPAGKEIGDTVEISPASFFMQLHPGSRKYIDHSRSLSSLASYKDIIVYRLAQTYLFAAEALMRQGKNSEALKYINPLRERAGVPELTEINQDILLEVHARELALEGHRWYMLKRLGILVERVREFGGEADKPNHRINIQPYHVRKPIPQTEVELIDGYPQNEGYETIGN
jgi:hypothetical protein